MCNQEVTAMSKFIIVDGLLCEASLAQHFIEMKKIEFQAILKDLKDLGIELSEKDIEKIKSKFILKCLYELKEVHRDTVKYIKSNEYRNFICPKCKDFALGFKDKVICEKCKILLPQHEAIRLKTVIVAIHKGSNNTHFLLSQNEKYYLNLLTGSAINKKTFKNLYEIQSINEVFEYKNSTYPELDSVICELIEYEEVVSVSITNYL